MKKQSDLSFRIVDFLRFPLIMIVVLIHCYYIDKTDVNVQETAPCFFALIEFLQHKIYTTAVPLFFFISGFLFFRNGIPSIQNWIIKIKSRIKTLVIPYILWNTIGLGIFMLKISPWLILYFPQYADYKVTMQNIFQGYLALPYGDFLMPYDLSLWFIRNLIIVLAFSPVICIFFKYLRGYAILVSILLMHLYPEFLYGSFSSMYYFMLGALLPILGFDLADSISKIKWYSLIIYAAGIIISYYVSDIFMVYINSFGIISILYIGFEAIKHNHTIPEKLAQSTFFIYAFHALYISVTVRIVTSFIPPTDEITAFISYITAFAILTVGSYIMFYILNKLYPTLLSILCGSRS